MTKEDAYKVPCWNLRRRWTEEDTAIKEEEEYGVYHWRLRMRRRRRTKEDTCA